MALETRYAVIVQVASSIPAESDPRIWSRETLTTEVSITSRRVGNTTAKAIIHLLDLFILCNNRRYARHPDAQHMILVGILIKYYLYRDPLHNLDVITQRIFRRKE